MNIKYYFDKLEFRIYKNDQNIHFFFKKNNIDKVRIQHDFSFNQIINRSVYQKITKRNLT